MAIFIALQVAKYPIQEGDTYAFEHTDAVVSTESHTKLAAVESAAFINKAEKPNNLKNPHWNKEECNACHLPGNKYSADKINNTNTEKLCMSCHENDISHLYIHPSFSKPSEKTKKLMQKSWGNDLRLNSNGNVTCLTCHDVLNQCLPERMYQVNLNKYFLRKGPYRNKQEICYQCHDPEKYQKVNVHEQYTKTGNVIGKKCLLCHESNSQTVLNNDIPQDLTKFPLIKGFDEQRSTLCIRCHKNIEHPKGTYTKASKKTDHLVRMPEEVRKRYLDITRKQKFTLPLEPYTERIYCGTCHEVHQSGVFKENKSRSQGQTNHMLRTKNICIYCHKI